MTLEPIPKRPDEQRDGAVPEYRWSSIWKAVLIYILAFVAGTFFLGREGVPPDSVPMKEQQDVGYRPFANPNDTYNVVIGSDDDTVFGGDTFSNLLMNSSSGDISRQYLVNLSKCALLNHSVKLYIELQINGKGYREEYPLLRYMPAPRSTRKLNLFASDMEKVDNFSDFSWNASTQEKDTDFQVAWKTYYLPTLTLSPIIDFSSPLPDPVRPYFHLVDRRTKQYYPLIYINNFWVIKEHFVEVNATTVASPVNFTITLSPLPLWKFSMYMSFDQAIKMHLDLGTARADDTDEMKRIFLETSPYLLGITFVVQILHVLFEYLAFSNDVKFWRHRKDFSGISLRTLIMNCYSQTIIFLYLMDGDETSWTILVPSGIGVLIEFWKVGQTARVVRGENGRWSLQFNKGYDKQTRKHDDTAVRYLLCAVIPALLCYSAYSAVYDTHKSWYSFLIHSQVRFIYFFGFAMMTPQIFINYKMKTVARLPWRTFVYRALNTVIDDLFAFIVKMPWLHRLACFRDDLVFVILLYQRWIYPVDTYRGDDGEPEGESDHEKSEHTSASLSLKEKESSALSTKEKPLDKDEKKRQ